MEQVVPENIIDDWTQTTVTIYIGLATFTILFWEYVITLSDEVEYIWNGRKGLLVYLFLMNRYLIPLGFIVNLVAYVSPTWTQSMWVYPFVLPAYAVVLKREYVLASFRCQHFVRYEGSMTVVGINIVGVMMLLRVHALYSGQRFIVGLVASVLVIEIAVNAWLLSKGQAVVHASGIHSCTMIFDPSVGPIASASAWLPLIYDTMILVLTLYRTWRPIRRQEAGIVMKTLVEDGLVYYSVIFSITLVLTVMIIFADPGLKNITAQLELLLTVTMMSRITLNLRKQGRRSLADSPTSSISLVAFTVRESRQRAPGMSHEGVDLEDNAEEGMSPLGHAVGSVVFAKVQNLSHDEDLGSTIDGKRKAVEVTSRSSL